MKFEVTITPVHLSTTQRDAISSPGEGSIIYNTTESKLEVFDGVQWTDAGGSPSGGGSSFADIWAANTLMSCGIACK